MIIHKSKSAIPLPLEHPPQLIVVIDTEEEFDWSQPVDRNSTSVTAIQYINRVQDIFDEYGITPCYVIDYPIASQKQSYMPLASIFHDNRCEIGAHLHPWVTPPDNEELLPENTYPGNLEKKLEHNKLKNLTDTIRQHFDFQPTIYKAGRYGFGLNTQAILTELGYQIDLSFCPPVNHGSDGGPDYSLAHAQPFWFDDNKNLLEIPITGSFVGLAGGASKFFYEFAQAGKKLKMPGIFSRLNVVDRLVLSPEGFSPAEHIKITKFLYNKGVRTFTWSFHSPAVMPGATPYVNNEHELKKFLDSFRHYFDFFFNKMHGVATTPTKLKNQLESI